MLKYVELLLTYLFFSFHSENYTYPETIIFTGIIKHFVT
jgi:hypothetical protein